MRFPFPAIALAIGCIAAPALAQDATPDAATRIKAMTCRDFLALDAKDQETVKTAMLAHASGDPPPDTPQPETAAAAQDSQPKPVPKPAPRSAGAAGAGTESGKTAPDEGGARRLVGMRTSCEGDPDGLALNALRAAFGNTL